MQTINLPISVTANAALNADNTTLLRALNLVQGDVYQINVAFRSGDSAYSPNIGQFAFNLRAPGASANLISVNALSGSSFVLDLSTPPIALSLGYAKTKDFQGLMSFTDGGAIDIVEPFTVRLANSFGGVTGVTPSYVSSVNGVTSAVTLQAAGTVSIAQSGQTITISGGLSDLSEYATNAALEATGQALEAAFATNDALNASGGLLQDAIADLEAITYTIDNPSGFTTQTALNTASFTLQSQITALADATGLYYPIANPSNFTTPFDVQEQIALDLSEAYALTIDVQNNVLGPSGYLSGTWTSDNFFVSGISDAGATSFIDFSKGIFGLGSVFSEGIQSINLGTSQILRGNNTLSIDWLQGELYQFDGPATLNWSTSQLLGTWNLGTATGSLYPRSNPSGFVPNGGNFSGTFFGDGSNLTGIGGGGSVDTSSFLTTTGNATVSGLIAFSGEVAMRNAYINMLNDSGYALAVSGGAIFPLGTGDNFLIGFPSSWQKFPDASAYAQVAIIGNQAACLSLSASPGLATPAIANAYFGVEESTRNIVIAGTGDSPFNFGSKISFRGASAGNHIQPRNAGSLFGVERAFIDLALGIVGVTGGGMHSGRAVCDSVSGTAAGSIVIDASLSNNFAVLFTSSSSLTISNLVNGASINILTSNLGGQTITWNSNTNTPTQAIHWHNGQNGTLTAGKRDVFNFTNYGGTVIARTIASGCS